MDLSKVQSSIVERMRSQDLMLEVRFYEKGHQLCLLVDADKQFVFKPQIRTVTCNLLIDKGAIELDSVIHIKGKESRYYYVLNQ